MTTTSFRPTKIERSLRGGCLTLTIDNPAARNPLADETAAELTAELAAADIAPDVRVVVLTGAGEHFSAGGNLNQLLANVEQGVGGHYSQGAHWVDLFRTLMYLSKPTICKVRGAAMAGGCGLVAASDFAIAADDARFGLPEVKIGLFPAQILPAVFRAVGRRHALDLALTGRTISAIEAQEIGLINRAVAPSVLDQEVALLVDQLVSVGPLTMAMGKRAFNQLTELDLRAALEAARDLRLPFLGSPELRSGIEQFMSRRNGAEPEENR